MPQELSDFARSHKKRLFHSMRSFIRQLWSQQLTQKMDYGDLIALLHNKDTMIEWLMDEELLAKSQLCQWCDVEVKLIKCDDRSHGYKWECRRQIDSKRHKVEKSLRSESWFKNSKMTLQEILKFTYWWSQDLNQLQIKHELGLCSNTAVDWELLPRNM